MMLKVQWVVVVCAAVLGSPLRAQDDRLGGIRPAALPEPGLVLDVTPTGNDATGAPFATLEGVRDAIRALKKKGPLPRGGVVVKVARGSYPLQRTFTLGPEDSGEPHAPISYQGAEFPHTMISGSAGLRNFTKVVDPALLARLPEEARGKVWQTSLKALGITTVPPARLGGFGSGRGFRTTPALRLFAGDRELPLARWPNQGDVTIASVLVADGHQIHGLRGSKTGRFTCASDRLARWTADRDMILSGYWFWDWAESRELVKAIDPATREITLEPPFHTYGYRAGQPFHATNLFSEIDQPGEWYLDRETLALYIHSLSGWPTQGAGDNQAPDGVRLTLAPMTAVVADKVEHVRFQRLFWDGTAADGIHLKQCRNVVIEGCRFSRLGGDAVVISGGSNCGVVSCDFDSLGRGGIQLSGGDRKSLTPGRHYVTNCHLHHLSCVDPTYTPAVLASGVGHTIAHNRIHDLPSSAIRLGGNDHAVEFNEVFNVVTESDDQGAVDMWGDPTFRGNVFRYNSWHDIGHNPDGSAPKLGRAAIRFDDAISGQLVEHNLFRRCGSGQHGFGAIQIHGGRDQVVRENLFVECPAAVTFSAWKLDRWQAFVGPKFPSPELDSAIYLARYPALATLMESANGNEFHRNLVLRCDAFILRQPPNTIARDNLVEAAGAPPAATPPDAAELRRAGLDPAKAARIGLVQDAWRKEMAPAP
jgi:hypothetical protein